MSIPIICKFKNIKGVTCYMNSILHILQQIEPFVKYINSDLYLNIINQKNNNNNKWIIIELSALIKLSISNNSIITPHRFIKSIGEHDDRWIENMQQDSSDFLEFLLAKIQEEIGINSFKIPKFNNFINDSLYKGVYEHIHNGIEEQQALNMIEHTIMQMPSYKSYVDYYSKEYSPIKKMFTSFNKYNKICSICNNQSIKYEPNNILHLAIPNKTNINLYDCLELLITKTIMNNDNLYDCEFCKNKTICYDQTLLWFLPNILIISLKRFNNFMKKNNININYPVDNLNLSKYFDQSTPHIINNNYELIAVNLHYSGNMGNIDSGHYVSVIKNNNKWYLYDDSNPVIEVQTPQFNEAYLLFYKLCPQGDCMSSQ